MANQERPFIARFENQQDAANFDVVVKHPDCAVATEWSRGHFGPVEYLHSNFDGEHTYRRRRTEGEL